MWEGAVGCMNMKDNLWIIALAGLGWAGWAGGVDRQRQRPRVSLATLRAEVVWAQVSGGRGTGDMSTMNDVHQFRSRTPSFLISAEPPTQVHTSKYWHAYRRNIYLDLDLPFAQITKKRKNKAFCCVGLAHLGAEQAGPGGGHLLLQEPCRGDNFVSVFLCRDKEKGLCIYTAQSPCFDMWDGKNLNVRLLTFEDIFHET